MFLTWIISDSAIAISQGFLLCASLIIAVGPQNLFVLRQGLRGKHLFATALICALADLLLISVGVGGLGTFIRSSELLLNTTTWGGAMFLLGYGVRSLRAAWQNQGADLNTSTDAPEVKLWQTALTILAISLLNPAAYLDTVLMVGTTSSQYPVEQRIIFGAGAVMASTLWFFTLTYGSSRLKPLLSRPAAWRTLDAVSGCMMCAVSISTCGILRML